MSGKFCQIYGIGKVETPPYRPQSNGLVEQMHGTLVPLIHKHCDRTKGKWPEIVQLALGNIWKIKQHADENGF